jgi:hypothetical protein
MRCDPPGIVWHFEHGENPSNPEHGQWCECECYGTAAQRDRVPEPDEAEA